MICYRMELLVNILLLLGLVGLNAFFVATEFAIVKVRKSKIDTLVQNGQTSAKHAQKIVEHLNSYLSACQLGITLASLGLGWIGEPTVSRLITPLLHPFHFSELTIEILSFAIGYSIVTALHVVLGELVPKSLAIISAEKIAVACAAPLIWFYKATYPVIWLFNTCTSLILGLFGIRMADEHEDVHSDDEIVLLMEESYRHGLIDQTELTYVENIFESSDKVVREIMTPRTEMICIFKDDSFEKILTLSVETQVTRFPVCENSKDNVLGFIHIKDVYQQKLLGEYHGIDGAMREMLFVQETMPIHALFATFQKTKAQIATIVDEYGGTMGIISIEDILEAIVGEIQDEFDDEDEQIQKISETQYIVGGHSTISTINRALGLSIVSEEADTIGGFICSELEIMPEVHRSVTVGNATFEIIECDKHRVNKVEVTLL